MNMHHLLRYLQFLSYDKNACRPMQAAVAEPISNDTDLLSERLSLVFTHTVPTEVSVAAILEHNSLLSRGHLKVGVAFNSIFTRFLKKAN